MPQRHSYPKSFKAQVVQECLQPGASIASVALGHGINANLVRKWIPLYRDLGGKNLPAFLPLKLEPNVQTRADPTIKIDVPCGHGQLVVNWPANDPEGCARFVRGLTR
ncbi:IS66-like element accessory protein TnpA [Pseudomonas quasicaspiana]|uniref:IS66-like element accessory protein TnpA n=1 Tax=Pseudomonas quasicaspiana TaxID=2829821 RepID=UPI001E551D1A|nr:transposase [Pseudomonas quasicaspiana]MCD5975591.1 transposase [Pseudomonas quasicaspiana]